MVIGGVEIPNRKVMPPMTTRLADEEGNITDARYRYGLGRAFLIRPVVRISRLSMCCH
jgi:2,4-dienoyl-CoA reductase-like NADH-dependent reductase (Old Yellow Enzyme family)